MKRMLSILLTVCMLLSMVPAVLAADPITGTCGTGLTWSYDEAEAKLTIEGTGAMTEFGNTSAVPWSAYRSVIKTVEIAEGVTTIGKYAFNNHSALTGIIIPNSVTTIGEKSFYGCTSLLTAAIGNGVVEFGTQAFSNCTELFAVTIGSGVTEIANKTFQNCNKVTEIYYVGSQSEWENVDIATSNGGLYGFDADKVFYMETAATGASKDVIWTFDPLTFTLTISGEGAMKDYADTDRDWYDYRSAVRTIVVGPGVTELGTTAFRYCSNANTVYIPATVTAIHDNSFAYCKGLLDVYYGSSEGDWATIEIGSGNTYLTGAEIHYAGECAHTNVTEKVISNGDETHTLKVVCACGVVVSETGPLACSDETGDLKCEICGGAVSETTPCDHGKDKIDNTYEAHDNGTHTQTTTCACGEVVYSGIENCYDNEEDDDELCDFCGSAVLEKPVCDGTNHPNAEVRYEAADKEMDAADVYFHFVTLYCPECEIEVGEAYTELCSDGSDENSICDYCEVGTPCSHEGYENWTDVDSNGNNTHTTYERCGRCDSRVSHVDAACTDEDKNNVCDVCEGDVEGIFWSLENGVLTIYGKGPMEDYASFTGMPWSAERDTVTEIIIEDGVTHIGARSFYRCVLATKVTIAASVKSIGDSAFYRCDSLKTVDFGGEKADWTALLAATGTNNEKLTAADVTVSCIHTNTTAVETANNDGKTHTVTTTCADCGNVETESVDCTAGDTTYTKGENNKHTATVKCTVCEQTLSTAEEDCTFATAYTDNEDRTHTVTKTCTKCTAATTAVEACVDADDNDVCDLCKASLVCTHNGSFTHNYVGNNDHYTHVPFMICSICGDAVYAVGQDEACSDDVDNNDVCDLCGQDISCLHEEAYNKTRYEDNGDRTHKVIVYEVCDMEGCDGIGLTETVVEDAEACEDTDGDRLCDKCGHNLTCAHEEVTRTVTYLDNYTHEVKFVCKECKNVTFSQIDKCVDLAPADKKCDVCEGVCAHNFETAYTQISTEEKHNKVETCEWCKAVVTTKEACADDVHDGVCDDCGAAVECKHAQKTAYETANGTHTIVKTCDSCATKDDSCDVCAAYWETVAASCADGEDDDILCDVCKADFAAAAIDAKAFATFEAARAAAQDGDTITVLKDITLTKELVIDGEELTIAGNNATITFEIEGTDAITACNGAELSLGKGLTVKAETALLWAYDSEIIVDSAVLEADTDYVAALADNGGIITIESGSIRSTNNTLKAKNGGMIIINDGTVECTAEETARLCTIWNAGGEVEINGGTVIGNNASDVLSAENGTVTITGGTVKNTATGGVFYRVNGSYVVSGGIFSAPVAEEFCAEGYECVKLGDIYSVRESASEIEKIDVAGANVTLGNALELNVMVQKDLVDAIEGDLTLYVTHDDRDGAVTYSFAKSELGVLYDYYYMASIRVAAAQMTDMVSVELRDAEGYVYTNPYSTSIRTYVMRNIDGESFDDVTKTLLVDMLNYGASAQMEFGYRTEDLANAQLTEAHQAIKTEEVACTNIREEGNNYVGSALSLEDCILLNFMFTNVSADVRETMYAEISFYDDLGELQEFTTSVGEYAGTYAMVTVDQILLAHASQPVTVKVYNADGSAYGEAVDSVESYIARQASDVNGLYENIMRFATAALAYANR